MRILSCDELTAVIGHELGHFRGEDTKFSLRFYPIYAGTGQALAALESQSENGARALALLPAFAILSFFMEQFAQAERAIGRHRELEADKAGVSVSSGRALATSLLKIGAFSPLWGSIRAAMVKALSQGKAYTNVSALYAEVAASSGKPELLDEVAVTPTAHPTDTHPPTKMRIQALGLSVAELRDEALAIDAEASSASLLTNPTEIEEELTDIEHRVLLELGVARLPEGEQQS
jgi:Zn-dependent protease with chaperone function